MAHKTRIMYIENKGGTESPDWWGTLTWPANLTGPARIGRVTFSKTGRSLKYQGKEFSKATQFKANYLCETGEWFWISGPKKRGVMLCTLQISPPKLMKMFAKSIGQRFASSLNVSMKHAQLNGSTSKKQILRCAQDDNL